MTDRDSLSVPASLEMEGNWSGNRSSNSETWWTEPIAVETPEQKAVLDTFLRMLKGATADGGRKRATGVKPPWWRDSSHEPAIFSHLNKWKHGEKRDPDSGEHPLVNLAWRALAIAHQETVGQVDPAAQ